MAEISNHYDTMQIIVGSLTAIGLPGLTGGVILQEVATYQDTQLVLPFVSVSPFGPETRGDELNDRDGWYYPTLVAIIAKTSGQTLEARLGWRQTIRRVLNNVGTQDMIALYGLPANPNMGQNYNLKVEPGNVIEPRAWLDRTGYISGMIVRAYFQEPRTP